MPEESDKADVVKVPVVTGLPPQEPPKPATPAEPEIPPPDISQPYKTVNRANRIKDKIKKQGKAAKKRAVPALIADGLNDQEIADTTGLDLDEVRKLRSNPFGAKHPKEVKPHKAKLEPKSKLPKGYKHPMAHPKKAQTLKPSEFGKGRAEEMEAAKPENQAKKQEAKERSRQRKAAKRTARPRAAKATTKTAPKAKRK